MPYPLSLIALVAFLAALIVAWVVVWYQLGRRADRQSRRRYHHWLVLLAMCALGGALFIFNGPAFISLGLVFFIAWGLLIQRVQMVTCPSCGALLSNHEWPAPQAFCYLCGARLGQPSQHAETATSPPEQ